MNEVIIVSDSHGLQKELEEIKQRHATAVKIHCGDSELLASSPNLANYQTVKGNCDWKGNFPEELFLDVNGVKIYVTHGHLYGVKSSLTSIQLRAEEVGAEIVCFGHSHIPFAEKVNNILFINPGSIALPKQTMKPSYVRVTWQDKSKIKVGFHLPNGEVIHDFSYAKSFDLKESS